MVTTQGKLITLIEILKTIELLTNKMLSAAQREEWKAVTEIDQQRVQTVKIISDHIPVIKTEEIEGIINNIILVNQELYYLVNRSYAQVGNSLKKLKYGNIMKNAYQNTALLKNL